MTAAIVAFVIFSILAFLIAAAISNYFIMNGPLWLAACIFVLLVMFAILLGSAEPDEPSDADYLRFILLWVVAMPALLGTVLSGLIGILKKRRGIR